MTPRAWLALLVDCCWVVAQTFTPQLSGRLARLTLLVEACTKIENSAGCDPRPPRVGRLAVEVTEVNAADGTPDPNSVLAEVSIPASTIAGIPLTGRWGPPTSSLGVQFPAPARLSSGHPYAFILTPFQPTGESCVVGFHAHQDVVPSGLAWDRFRDGQWTVLWPYLPAADLAFDALIAP